MQPAALRNIGRTIRQRRRQARLSQEALAQACGLSQTYVSQVESGARNLSILTLLAICRALELTPAELLADFTLPALRRLRLT